MARILVAAVVLAPFTLLACWRHRHALRKHARLIVAYGVVPIAIGQLAFTSAVARMDVAPALLMMYTAPAAVIVWLWVRHRQRPRQLTVVGLALAAIGLVLVLDIVSGSHLAWAGVCWAVVAMLATTAYFLLSAHRPPDLPSHLLAGTALWIGALTLTGLCAAGLLSLDTATSTAQYATLKLAWWIPLAALGILTSCFAYIAGIAASRRLGPRIASFVALLEVVAGLAFAALFLDEIPRSGQALGVAITLSGILVVTLDRSSASVSGRDART